MLRVRSLTSAISHCQDYASSNRTSQLDGFLDLVVSGTELLRTCEVGDRSRFAMHGQD